VSNPFIGEIRITTFNFAPVGWAMCDGQLLSISENTALFSLLGTFYGGNGTTNFALPNLQGRVPINFGSGPGGTTFTIGQSAGAYDVTLATTNLPAHAHPIPASNDLATSDSPSGRVIAQGGAYASPTDEPVTAAPTGSTGSGLPFSIESPYLTLNFIIALNGIFPPRS
jgi:microcystin-dependent protein